MQQPTHNAAPHVAKGAAYVRSTVVDDQARARALFGLIGERCGLSNAAYTGPRVYDLLETPQTLETLQRAMTKSSADAADAGNDAKLESFLAELYRRDLIELSADS